MAPVSQALERTENCIITDICQKRRMEEILIKPIYAGIKSSMRLLVAIRNYIMRDGIWNGSPTAQ